MLEDTCKYEMKITQENAELMYVCIYIYIYGWYRHRIPGHSAVAVASAAT